MTILAKIGRLPVFSSIALIVPIAVLASDANCPQCGLIDDFNNLRNALSQSLSAPASCLNCVDSALTGCDFQSLCQKLATNAETGYLYENSKGEKIPNFAMIQIEGKAAACLAQHRPAQSQDVQSKNSMEKIQKAHLQALKASAAFAKSVRDRNEQNDWFEITNASITIALEKAEQGKSPGPLSLDWTPPSREKIAKSLDELERVAKRKLSMQSREAYIEANYLQMTAYAGVEPEEPDPGSWALLNQNPFLQPSLFVNAKAAGGKEQVLRNQALLQKELDRVYGIFKTTQTQILGYLDERKATSGSDAIGNLKQRIQSIRMKVGDPTHPMSGCAGPNAFYSPQDHSFHICPQLMQMPEASLKMIIAHELSHSIDPCAMSDDLLSIRITENDRTGSPPPLDGEAERAEKQMRAYQEQAGYYPLKLRDPQPKAESAYAVDVLGMMKTQIMQAQPSAKVSLQSQGMSRADHPFSNTLACLQHNDSIGARAPSLPDFTRSLDLAIARMKKAGATEQSSPDLAKALFARANAQEFMSRYGACTFSSGSQGQSQLLEAFSDKVASEIMERDQASRPQNERKAGTFEAMGFFLAMGCPNVSAKLRTQTEDLLKKHKCLDYQNKNLAVIEQSLEASARSNDSHPSDADRVSRLFLANPKLRANLGCKAKAEARYCQ